MKRFVAIVTAALCVSTPAFAQTPPAKSTSPAQPVAAQLSPARLALARELFEVLRMEQMMDMVIKDLGSVLREQQEKEESALTVEQRRLLYEAVDESIAVMQKRMLDESILLYAAEFTEEELQASIEFYSSPVGQTMLDKQPKLSAASAELVREMLPEIQEDILRRFCSKVDCFAPPAEEPARTPS